MIRLREHVERLDLFDLVAPLDKHRQIARQRVSMQLVSWMAGEENLITDPAQLGAPLAQLVAMAEKSGGGKVMAISADHDNAKSGVIEVELAKSDGTTQDFAMAADGTMTKVVANQDEDQDGQDEDAD